MKNHPNGKPADGRHAQRRVAVMVAKQGTLSVYKRINTIITLEYPTINVPVKNLSMPDDVMNNLASGEQAVGVFVRSLVVPASEKGR